MTSRRMQLKKEGHGLVVEANQSALLGERGGLNKKGSVLENLGEHWSIVTLLAVLRLFFSDNNTPMFTSVFQDQSFLI